MQDYSKFNKEAQDYFDSLPAFLQEDVMQSGVQAHTKQDLMSLAQNLTQGKQSGESSNDCCK